MLGDRRLYWIFALGAIVAGAIAFSSGCEIIAAVDRTRIPAAAGGGGPGGSGGAGGTCDVSTCPGTDTDCQTVACVNDACGYDYADSGDACTDTGNPDAQVCDGAGTCVECVDNAQCSGQTPVCDTDSNTCVAEHCNNQVMDEDETDLNCGGQDCNPCALTQGCIEATDCLSGYCDTNAGTGGAGGGAVAGACAACTDQDDCISTSYWCDATVDGGTCTPDLQPGDPCDGDNERCPNDFCAVHGDVCCDEACDGTCRSCLEADTTVSDGTCADVTDGTTDPSGVCGNQATCEATTCTGGVCGDVTSGQCSAPACNSGTYEPPHNCNGSGNCVATGADEPCGPWACVPATGCNTTCSGGGDCVGTAICNGSNECCFQDGEAGCRDENDCCTAGATCDGSNICHDP